MTSGQEIIVLDSSESDREGSPVQTLYKRPKVTKSDKIKLPKKLPPSNNNPRPTPSATISSNGKVNPPLILSPVKRKSENVHDTSTDEVDSEDEFERELRNASQISTNSSGPYNFNYSPEKDPIPQDDDELPDIFEDNYKSPLLFDDDIQELDEQPPRSGPSSSARNYTKNKVDSPLKSRSNVTPKKKKKSTPKKKPRVEDDDFEIAFEDEIQPQGMSKKEQKRLEVEKRKEEKRLEKERKKAEFERERELRKTENELRKNQRPGEVIKFMTALIDQRITSYGKGKGDLTDLNVELALCNVNHEFLTSPLIPNSITFRREMVFQAMGEDMKMHKISKFQDEDQIFVLIPFEELIPMIVAQNEGKGGDIVSHIKTLQSLVPNKKMTLFLFGVEYYYKKMKLSTQKEFRDRINQQNGDQGGKRKRKPVNSLPNLSKLEVESALIELQLETNVTYRHVSDAKILSKLIYNYTKSIAEAPFKKDKMDNNFDWYAIGDLSGSVMVEKDGTGMKALWLEQIQLFNNTGIDLAKAIVGRYPAPKVLHDAYQNCRTVEEGFALLKDITARVGVGPLAKNRKVGPELSKKMYRLFTTTRADRTLASENF